MTRREAVRWAIVAAFAAPLMAACGDDGGRRREGGAVTDVDLVRSEAERSAGAPEAIPDVVAALHAFAGGLHADLASTPGNLVWSPYSVAVALGMTLPGAGGHTATEMRDVLGVGDEARFHAGLNALTAYVEGLAGRRVRADGSKAELALDTANQLYGQRDVAWERDFLDLLAREYGAGLRTVDYRAAHEQARGIINDWVAGRTRDRIPELIPTGVLDSLTRLVLVNALYLKAPWEHPFETSATAPMPFRLRDGTSVDVDTMLHPKLTTSITEGDGWTSAQLPYAGGRLAMTVVLPEPGRAREVEQQLMASGLAEALSGGRRATLELRLPKWTFRTPSPLKGPLQELGMRDAFDPDRADFGPMTREDLDLYVTDVVHEGFIAVDEEGTEAAAATAVAIGVTSEPVTEPFHVDRPFLFAIHDVAHGTPLFLGRVDDPRA